MSQARKKGFRLGRSGACEARLYLFTGMANGEGESRVKRIAACSLHEALVYMRRWHADLDILRVELVDVIEMVSGSPLN
jgi:Uri superfamily endonuclease